MINIRRKIATANKRNGKILKPENTAKFHENICLSVLSHICVIKKLQIIKKYFRYLIKTFTLMLLK